jgi:hypothetical protein
MNTQYFATRHLASAAFALAFAFTAQAQNPRSFMAVTGNDANNCTSSANCRTLARALEVTNPRGEIIAVTSGGYGTATITQPVSITATGVVASLSSTSAPALTINTVGSVNITGLSFHGEGTASNGILVTAVGFLRLYSVQIENFATDGVQFNAPGSLAVYDSDINSNGHDGILLSNASGRAYVHNTSFDGNTFAGCDSAAGMMTAADSSAHNNSYGFFANGGTLTLQNDRAIFNLVGIAASGTSGGNGAGQLYFSNSLVADNTTSYSVGVGGTMAGTSPGTTLIAPLQATVGSLSAPITLQ